MARGKDFPTERKDGGVCGIVEGVAFVLGHGREKKALVKGEKGILRRPP